MKSNFLESIHFLRGFAALTVLLGHNFGWYSVPLFDKVVGLIDAQWGVTTFFIISGFVLPLSLHNGYRLRNFATFIAKRFIRIEPTYIASTVLALVLLMIKTRISANGVPYEFNLLQFTSHFLYLIPFTDFEWYNDVYWTLAVEFQFYIIIALLFPLLRKSIVIQILTLLAFISLWFIKDTPIGLFAMAPKFAVGMLSYLIYSTPIRTYKFAYLAIMVLALMLVGLSDEFSHVIIIGLVVVLILFWTPRRNKLSYLGDISYSLYISHYPIMLLINQVTIHFFGELTGHPILYLIAILNLLLAIVVAHFMYIFIEKPTIQMSKRIQY
jgi:peptidoglycan/LPS O-acetylase OafA/YrhL